MRCATICVTGNEPEFEREELHFSRFWATARSWRHTFDHSMPSRRRAASVLGFLDSLGEIKPGFFDGVAIFCHGLRHWTQAGFVTKKCEPLAESMSRMLKPDGKIVLYSCSNAKGFALGTQDGNKGLCLASRLHALTGREVFAHTTAGPTTRNPHVVRFSGGNARYIVAPGSALWSEWRRELWQANTKNNRDKMRMLFPFLSQDQILTWLTDRHKFEVTHGRFLV